MSKQSMNYDLCKTQLFQHITSCINAKLDHCKNLYFNTKQHLQIEVTPITPDFISKISIKTDGQRKLVESSRNKTKYRELQFYILTIAKPKRGGTSTFTKI